MTDNDRRMRQCSLLALYGEKPGRFEKMVMDCQAVLESSLGERFRPADMRAVHATIVGFERAEAGSLINLNYLRLRNERRMMDVRGYLDWVAGAPLLPFTVRIGGYAPDEQPFLDRGMPPYLRSFGIYGDKAVMIGWPVEHDGAGERQTHKLDELRRAAGAYNILHGYHSQASSIDNAFYFRVGAVQDLHKQEVSQVEANLRGLIATTGACYVEVTCHVLKVVTYVEQTLPENSTQAYSLKDFDATMLLEDSGHPGGN